MAGIGPDLIEQINLMTTNTRDGVMLSLKRYSALIFFVTLFTFSGELTCWGDVIEEQFEIGDPFFFGLSGTDPGDQESTRNGFISGPVDDGLVRLRRPDTVLAGLGELRFTTHSSGLSRIDYDLGDVANTTLPDHRLLATRFELSDIDADADGDIFTFQVTADFVSGVGVTNVNDLIFSATDANLSVSVIDDGLFQVEVTNTSALASSVSITGANGKKIRQLSFANLNADVANDELTSRAFRSLLAVPEPSATALIWAGMIAVVARRRRCLRGL